MKYENLNKDELLSIIEKLELDLIKIAHINHGIENEQETESANQDSILEFINAIAIPSAKKTTVAEFSKVLLKAVKDYTGANLATFNLYNPTKKELALLHFEGEDGIIKTFFKIGGKNIVKATAPVDDETYQLMIKKPVRLFNTFTEATFGAVPKVIDHLIRLSTGINRVYPIAHIVDGKLFASTMLAFKKGKKSPSSEMLTSYAHLISVSLKRYNAEKELEDSEIKNRTYIEHAPVAIFISNDKGKYIDVNPKACELSGYTRNELLELSIRDLLEEAKDIDSFQQLKKKGNLSHDLQLIKKNGARAYVRLDAISLPNNQFMAFVIDISNQKKAENQLRKAKKKAEKSERKLVEAQELSQIGSWEYITETDTVTWSKELNKIYERSPDAPAPKFSIQQSYYTAESFEKLKKAVEDCILHEIPYEIELDIITAKGNIKQIISIGAVLKDENNQIIGTHGTAQDITKKKIIERELIAAKEKAEESDRLKSAFLANMSHEIRTPMNGILGFTSLLKNPNLTGEKQKKYISIIEKSGDRMLKTINDIIDISKIESGQVGIIISEVNLNNQIDELLVFFLPEAKKKNIQLSITSSLPDQQANMKTDKEKINSILTNIIKNAIKYTQKGSIEIGYTVRKKEGKKEFEFFVKDTGIGIPKNRLDAIFNRFVQADIEDRQVFEGSGLGLSIAKAYVEMLGGTIWVESKVGIGSQFYFTIPYQTKKQEIGVHQIENSNKKISLEKKLKILIVEDDEIAITFLSIVLEPHAKELLITKNGNKAVEMCKADADIDLILMDIKIPGINGYEATKQIREFNKKVFIIAQTAYAQTYDSEKAIDAGCNQYISKPIDKEKLLQIISSRL